MLLRLQSIATLSWGHFDQSMIEVSSIYCRSIYTRVINLHHTCMYLTLLQLIDGTRELLAGFGDCHFVNIMSSWLPFWMIDMIFYKTTAKLAVSTDKLSKYIEDRIEEHRSTFDADHMRDFIDIYLRDRLGEKDFTDRRFVCNVMTFMPDALDTIAYILMWIILYLAHNPGIYFQKNIQPRYLFFK